MPKPPLFDVNFLLLVSGTFLRCRKGCTLPASRPPLSIGIYVIYGNLSIRTFRKEFFLDITLPVRSNPDFDSPLWNLISSNHHKRIPRRACREALISKAMPVFLWVKNDTLIKCKPELSWKRIKRKLMIPRIRTIEIPPTITHPSFLLFYQNL